MLASRWVGWTCALSAVAALLVVGGCGCTEDSGGFTPPSTPSRITQAQIGMEIPAIEVPNEETQPVKVDVMFLLDDSLHITQRVPPPGLRTALGEILGEDADPPRIKTDVAQQIFSDAVQRLMAQLLADHGGTEDDYDLAFGVSRFEDYANFVRSSPKSSVPSEVSEPVDELARPFILNQPLLRQKNTLFNSLFGPALARETPGDGGLDPQDGQSALEALYQLATGAGFDGNDDGDTGDSGAACFAATQLNPGVSGDVPAPDFGTEGTEPGSDVPQYVIGETIASGNLGGAGWRPDSIRLVVLFSDICTVTMLEEELGREGPISNTPSASSTPGEPGAGPRELETVTSVQAFACTDGTAVLDPGFPGPDDAVSQQAYERFGVDGGTIPVAPIGTNPQAKGALLQQTIDALNEMDIEVLCIGIRQTIEPGPNKPNVPGPTIPGQNEVEAIPDPSMPPGDKSPFTWMSAVSILTGAFDTDASDPDPRWVPGLPLVYNLQTLNPENAPVTDDLVEDLSDRVGAWLPYRALPGGGGGGDPGSVYFTVVFDLTNPSADLTLTPPPFALLPESDPDGLYISQSGNTQVVRVPCYFVGTPAPDPVRVAWTFRTQRTDDDTIREALLATMPFNFTTTLTPAGSVPGGVNPTGGHDPGDIPAIAPVSGTVDVSFPAVAAETPAQSFPVNATTMTAISSGEAFFRDLSRQLPAGTSLETMAGPLDGGDVPAPPFP